MPPPAADDEAVIDAPLTRQKTEYDGDRDRERLRKAVSYAESDTISPMMLGKSKEVDDFCLDRPPRQHRANLAKRLSGRGLNPLGDQSLPPSSLEGSNDEITSGTHNHHHHHHRIGGMIEEVTAWIQAERTRLAARRERRKGKAMNKLRGIGLHDKHDTMPAKTPSDGRRDSDSSESSNTTALEKLESIIGRSSSVGNLSKALSRKSSSGAKRRSSLRKLRTQSTASSDAEHFEGDAIVPSCDEILDNTKTMSYLGGTSVSQLDVTDVRAAAAKDKEAWLTFKLEILRLAHTLKLKAWRQVPMERSGDISVERLAGALTNSVYVVAPPSNLPFHSDSVNGDLQQGPRRPPPKLLLRIYGPQVEHLIDRESELQILRRLARQKIGPRLLGTFTNGRFEEYFHARTLKPQDLRVPDTSKQIAKRMRELHDGIELLIEERNGGPFVWRNWDKWVDRCEKIMSYTDGQVMSGSKNGVSAAFKSRGFVCGVPWSTFRKTVERYRAWLDEQYGGPDKLREHLVFAHNDTQYGNILRLEPPGESPLLLPANKHKQLVVIDFEYSNANMTGLEFANHFTEWCYNYHDPVRSYACNTVHYPTIEEQQRFIRAYVGHRPQVSRAASTSPKPLPRDYPSITSSLVGSPVALMTPAPATTLTSAASALTSVISSSLSSLSSLSLHHRTHSRPESDNPYFPPTLERAESTTSSYTGVGEEDSPEVAAEISRLMLETRLWRTANSSQWVLWGMVQARVPGFEAWERKRDKKSASASALGHHHQPHEELTFSGASDPLDEEAKANIQDLADRRPEGRGFEAMRGEEGGDEEDGTGEEDGEEGEEEFDCLAYSRDRAMFFWGDCLQLGFVTEEELKSWGIWGEVKVVTL